VAVVLRVGNAFATTFTVAVFTQLFASDPETVYTVVTLGETFIELVVGPLVQVNVPGPLAVKATLLLAHTVADGGVMATVGSGFAITGTRLVDVQPKVFVPATVYAVVTEGVSDTVLLCMEPFHVNVIAPLATKVAAEYAHTVV
jgi:hypothetical protein